VKPEETAVATIRYTSKAPYFMLALALIGIADASYDSWAVYTGGLLWCPPPIDGCNTVASSPYSRIFGIPLGYLGLVFYLGMSALAASLASDPFARALRWIVLLYAGVGMLGSVYFFYVQRTYIHAFCVYCLLSGLLTLLLFIVAAGHFRATRTDPAAAQEPGALAT
jgi:uncharacterized membrane protein